MRQKCARSSSLLNSLLEVLASAITEGIKIKYVHICVYLDDSFQHGNKLNFERENSLYIAIPQRVGFRSFHGYQNS